MGCARDCLHALPFSLKRAKQISLIFQEFFREASKFHLLAFLFCASETSSEITTFLAQKRKGCLKIWEASWETETDNSASNIQFSILLAEREINQLYSI